MSSTNRRLRNNNDYYITPVSEILTFLENFEKVGTLQNKNILDPCAGGDSENPMSYPKALHDGGIQYKSLTTLDIRTDSRADIITDFLLYKENRLFDVVMTNTPFELAMEIIESYKRKRLHYNASSSQFLG
jgi:hypothetical protein